MANKEYWDKTWSDFSLTDEEKGPKAGDEYLFPLVMEAVSLLSGEKLVHLEAGCGIGIWNFLLSRNFPGMTSVGIDVADCILEVGKYAREKGYPRVYFSRSDIRGLPFGNGAFSFITCFGVIEHFEDPVLILKEFQRVLAPGGILFLDTPNHGLWEHWNRFFPIDEDEAYYSPDELSRIAEKAGLKVIGKKAVGFSNSVMTPLYHLYDYRPDSLLSRIYHLILRPLKSFLKLFDPWLDSSLGFYSVIIARKE
ncbi:MAG: methyltransferase domain-containing protein [bacterium]